MELDDEERVEATVPHAASKTINERNNRPQQNFFKTIPLPSSISFMLNGYSVTRKTRIQAWTSVNLVLLAGKRLRDCLRKRRTITKDVICRLTHKSAKKGRYASEEENGEDMCQIQTAICLGDFQQS